MRNKIPVSKKAGEVWKQFPPHGSYVGAPVYRLIKGGDGELDIKVELLEADYEKCGIDLTSKGGRNLSVSFESLVRLKNNTFLGDEIINAYASMFNKRQVMKRSKKEEHRPAHMFGTHFIGNLCFEGGNQKFVVTKNEKWMHKKRVPVKSRAGRERAETGAMDIFKCDKLFFPMNEGNLHWVFYSINPNSLRQEFYDSMHGILTDDRGFVSECLHRWTLYEHHIRHGRPHPKQNDRWSVDFVLSNEYVLGNSLQ